MPENQIDSNPVPEDQDIDFDMHEESTTATAVKPEDTGSGNEKEDLQARKEFRPLTDQDKQPKLQDDETMEHRIKEMNRRTAIDD
jgi:hypothetical protein